MKKLVTLMAMAGMLAFALSCSKDDSKDNKKNNEEPNKEEPVEATVTIDGDFADWAALDASKVAVAKNNPDSPWEAVSEIRCYATEDFVFYYIRYDSATLSEFYGDATSLPIRLCINTDGEFTSGYQSYFLDGYDFIIEGSLLGEDGAWTAFDGTLHQRVDGKWIALLEPGNSLVTGAGAGNEYEIMLFREVFNGPAASMPMGKTFQTGIRFYDPGWGELSNMPNASMEEGEGNGWGHLLNITTY